MDKQWLPRCLRHLDHPYVPEGDESIVVAEISGQDRGQYEGERVGYTTLVPLARVDEVLRQEGGMGWEVQSWGPSPVVGEGLTYHSDFWIQGPRGSDDKLEPLVVGWTNHNKRVLMPNNGMLMCYGLIPRLLSAPGRIAWDDPDRLESDVVTVTPVSHYSVMESHSEAEVRIQRSYLEDYASLKGCAVIATYYEQRRCFADEEVEQILGDEDGKQWDWPGRKVHVLRNISAPGRPLVCQAWGCRLVLKPGGRPISEEPQPELDWPGCAVTVTNNIAHVSPPMHVVYVSDKVLSEFEERPEYCIHPGLGSVDYDGRWSLDHSRRIGRDYIGYEIRKVYEGCPPAIIRHVHRHVVPEAVAMAQQGQSNIGQRAAKLVDAYLDFGDELAALLARLGTPVEAKSVVSLSREDMLYHGWWTRESLRPLGRRAPPDMSKVRFLERCKDVYLGTLEGLGEAPIRSLLRNLGVRNDEVEGMRALKLLGVLAQLCTVSTESGLNLKGQPEEVLARWRDDEEPVVHSIRPLFELATLRNRSSHPGEWKKKREKAFRAFDIDPQAQMRGWGQATDRIYDELTQSLVELAALLSKC